MPVAICDPQAFFPLRSLVEGPLASPNDLVEAERFVRTVVLHDEIWMDLEPGSYDPEADEELTEEELRAGGRAVVVAVGPSLAGYDFFTIVSGPGQPETPDIPLSPSLIEVAREFSNAGEGNVYYEAHVEFLQRIVGTVEQGGSALLAGDFGSAAVKVSREYPEKLFENLDNDWQRFAREADAGALGLMVPPVLSIILTRAARREAIPAIINDLRAEWSDARAKVWALIDRLRTAETVEDALDIRRELEEASRMLSPTPHDVDTGPARVLWELITGGVSGAATALVSGGSPEVGAAVGAIGAASRSVPPLARDFGRALFGRGAFDLARRIRREVKRSEYDALARLISDAEKSKLGL
jgi:hypothetical protein